MVKKQIKDLKAGEFFSLVQVEEPKESQVWVRGEYDKSEKKYSCYKFSDVCHEHFWKGSREVYTEFYF